MEFYLLFVIHCFIVDANVSAGTLVRLKDNTSLQDFSRVLYGFCQRISVKFTLAVAQRRKYISVSNIFFVYVEICARRPRKKHRN